MRKFFCLIIIGFIFACQQDNKEEKAKLKEPFCEVLFLGDKYVGYVDKPSTDSRKKIADNIFEVHLKNSEYSDLVWDYLCIPFKDSLSLNKSIEKQNLHQKEIKEIISKSYVESNKYLRNDSVTFYILPSGKDSLMVKMGGIFGLTIGSKKILLVIDTDIISWEQTLQYTIAHEFHHTYLIKKKFKELNWQKPLHCMIPEGMADSFAHILYPDFKAPWINALSKEEENKLWLTLKPLVQQEDYKLGAEVMFGSEKYPMWTGYTIGYHIVQSALYHNKNVTMSPDYWTMIPPEKMLEMSSY